MLGGTISVPQFCSQPAKDALGRMITPVLPRQ
jgi:hypothetical protein